MRGPKPQRIELTDRQRAELERIVRRTTSPQREVTRAKIILEAADGANNEQIARELGIHREKVRAWRGRWLEAAKGLATMEAEGDDKALGQYISRLLADQARPGAPATFSPEQLCLIIALACEPPEQSDRPVTHWTPQELADEAIKRQIVTRISPRHVGRFLNGRPTSAASKPLLAQPRSSR